MTALDPSRAEEPRAQSLARLADLLAMHAPHDGSFQLRVLGVYAIRRSRVSGDMVRATVSPTLCIVARGSKQVVLGREIYSCDTSRMIACRLMLARMVDVGSAGRQVGYLSASQFSREYARLFGSAPTRDIARLRAKPAPGEVLR
jgi:hypothetical protein